MKNKINIGIIGKNFGYQVIYKSFLKNKNFKISGFSFKSKRNKNLKIAKDIKIYPDWKKLILNKKINAIAIATPPKLNFKIIKFAIKNNKHIFCEKPFTLSIEEANYICDLIEKKKMSHMVNYEFIEIDAFRFFKKNFLNKKIKIDKIDLNWFVKGRKRNKLSWKEDFSAGGSIMFNYVCHAIYYLEFLFGKIKSIKSSIFLGDKNNFDSVVNFESGASAKIKVRTLAKNSIIKPVHRLKVKSGNNAYFLESKVDSLFNQFELKKNNKFLFKNKVNKQDFRIMPTYHNSKKFSSWILEKKIQTPNFFDGKRVHLIIHKMLLSSKKRKKIFIN